MDTDLTYEKALAILQNRVDYSLKKAPDLAQAEFSLEKIRAFLRLAGDPHLTYPVFHIAGTKGKGSTAALIASALQAEGYKTGLFTSPALQDFREQIQLNRQPIPKADFVEMMDIIHPLADRLPGLTTFEMTVGLALWYFQQRGVNAAVVEAGLGGKNDATNIVSPLVSVITSISYDHTHVLGNSLAEIAAHKAGIIKQGCPAVSAPQPADAMYVIREAAARQDAPLLEVGRDVIFELEDFSLAGQTVRVGMQEQPMLACRLSLLGTHQVENAATAYAALMAARNTGLRISDEAIQRGFASARWPGRFEVLQRNGKYIVLDGAHNRESARRLVEALQAYFPERQAVFVFGSSEDKDVEGMFAEFKPVCNELHLAQADHPRAMYTDTLAKASLKANISAQCFESVGAALAASLAGQGSLIVVTGSLFEVGSARNWLGLD